MSKFVQNKKTALLFILPQLIVTLIFFIWPAMLAFIQSFFYADAFGLYKQFAGFANFLDLFKNPDYLQALWVTLLLSVAITFLTLFFGLSMAILVNARTKAQPLYKSLLLWPYAVAPAVAAILWRFLCHPSMGWVTGFLAKFGIEFNYLIHSGQALLLIIVAAAWQQFSYNFLFYFAALKLIPKTIVEAAIIDGASGWRRFWQIIFPMLSPTTFFLIVMNVIYCFFDTFGVIQVISNGGPGISTTSLIFKVYQDGFSGLDPGSSSAQSVILMLLVIGLTMLQFKYLEKRVHYQ